MNVSTIQLINNNCVTTLHINSTYQNTLHTCWCTSCV